MKVVILAGGRGSRIAEESQTRPKPMIEIGGRPILWHIMKLFSFYGLNDFIICCGYKGYQIKEYFANFFLHQSDVRFVLQNNSVEYLRSSAEPWTVTLIDTGHDTMTGGRIKRIAPYLTENEAFCMTYGDGLADVNLHDLIAYHRAHKRLVTVTAVLPPGRYGALDLDSGRVRRFTEKPLAGDGLVSGGFFVVEPAALGRVADDSTAWEAAPLESLAADGELMAYPHRGYWAAMDTLRDKFMLEDQWTSGKAPWKVWD